MSNDRMREELAALAHDQWAGWMRYLFGKCSEVGDGCYEIPAEFVTRWERQAATSYSDLPEGERESDRKEADRVIALLLSIEG